MPFGIPPGTYFGRPFGNPFSGRLDPFWSSILGSIFDIIFRWSIPVPLGVYFGDFEGYIHELDADTGMITGLTKTNLKSISQVAVFSDKLFAQDIDGSIVGFNLK